MKKSKDRYSLIKERKLPFDKYDFYRRAVQSPEDDVKFYLKQYKKIRKGRKPYVLREDFCGTGAIGTEWVKLDKKHRTCGLDLDPEPMDYGRKNYIQALKSEQQERIALIKKDVLSPGLPSADIAVAVNFSYFLFKKREVLKKYFQNVFDSLNHKGLFIIDIFGGTNCSDAIEDKNNCDGFKYYWDQQSFDPVTNEAYFEIHFEYKKRKYKNIFNYDWRMWSIPEVREIMYEVGFQDVKVYWEGDDKNGGGNGVFSEVEKGESCLSWIAYVCGVK